MQNVQSLISAIVQRAASRSRKGSWVLPYTASESAPIAWAMRGHSASFNRPVRRRYESTEASLQRSRVTSCCSDISSEKIATGILYWIDACCAMLSVRDVLWRRTSSATKFAPEGTERS